MNEQLLLAIINFYESHIEQLKLAHAEKEKVNQMAYTELERTNDDLEEKLEEKIKEWKAIAGARLNLSEGHRIEKEKLKRENKKLKKISVAIDQNVKLVTKIETKKEKRKK